MNWNSSEKINYSITSMWTINLFHHVFKELLAKSRSSCSWQQEAWSFFLLVQADCNNHAIQLLLSFHHQTIFPHEIRILVELVHLSWMFWLVILVQWYLPRKSMRQNSINLRTVMNIYGFSNYQRHVDFGYFRLAF